MKTIALAFLGVALPGMALAQSATFEVNGFPASLHQAQVMALPNLHEEVAAPIAVEPDGFAASPVQTLILKPRGVARHDDTAAPAEVGGLVLMAPSASGR